MAVGDSLRAALAGCWLMGMAAAFSAAAQPQVIRAMVDEVFAVGKIARIFPGRGNGHHTAAVDDREADELGRLT